MDIVEDNLACEVTKSSQKRKDKENQVRRSNKRTKSDKEEEDEEYELWKKKILEEAAASGK